MALADQQAIQAGIIGIALMEAAGAVVANAVTARWSKRAVLVACGPGNNGGDGFVAARHLRSAGWAVTVAVLDGKPTLGDAAHHAALWDGPVKPLAANLLDGAGLVVDALFGAGLSRPLHGSCAQFIAALKRSNIPVCAVDLPSGLDGASGAILGDAAPRSEEHTSELQSLMRISYAVFCLKKKKNNTQ